MSAPIAVSLKYIDFISIFFQLLLKSLKLHQVLFWDKDIPSCAMSLELLIIPIAISG